MDILRSIKISEAFPSKDQIIVLNGDDSIQTAFQTLVNNNILSCPVIIKRHDGAQQLSIIDLADLVKFVVGLFSEDESLEQDLSVMMAKAEQGNFKVENIASLSNLSGDDPLFTVAEGATLTDIAAALASGFRRVVVVDKTGKIVNFITQSATLDVIIRHKQHLGELLQKKLYELGLGAKDVISVTESDKVIDAFKLFSEKKINAVAVIDSEGKICGNISVRDLRTVVRKEETIKRLYMTCSEFLELTTQEPNSPGAPVVIKPNDTLDTLLEKLKMHRIHRIFVVNDEYKPIGVVSLKDVLGLLVNRDAAQSTQNESKIEAANHPMSVF